MVAAEAALAKAPSRAVGRAAVRHAILPVLLLVELLVRFGLKVGHSMQDRGLRFVSISKGADGYRLAVGLRAGLVRCCAVGRNDCREHFACCLPKLSCSNKACNTPLAPPPVCACLCRAWRARGRRIGAVLGRAGHFRTSVYEFSGRFARCAWCRVTGECCSESICVRLFGSQVGRAARRTRPRASVECPAVVRTVPCWFCSSALGGCNAGGQRVVGREKRAYIFAARLTVVMIYTITNPSIHTFTKALLHVLSQPTLPYSPLDGQDRGQSPFYYTLT